MTAVIDSYELSPMQAGMLVDALRGGDPGVNIMQTIVTLREPVDEAHLLHAWRRVVERHQVLRSCFRRGGVGGPMQVVFDRVEIPVDRLDWRTLGEVERNQRLQALLDRESIRGIDLARAPLMRLALVRASGHECWMLLTNHHAILDGRARIIVLREILAFYEAFLRGEDLHLPLPRPYRDYIEWYRGLDHSAAKGYWRRVLTGFNAPTPLIVARDRKTGDETGSEFGSLETRVPIAQTAALKQRAREASVTLKTLLQGAWALLLQRYSGESDIVFGAARACRRSAFGGADDMVGVLINILPIRVQVELNAELVPWLQELRAQQSAMRDYEHTPLSEVQGWSEVPRDTPLFESVLVFENQTLDASMHPLGGAWNERRFLICDRANSPLLLNAWGDDELVLQLNYSRRRFADEVVIRMLGHLQTLLGGMAAVARTRLKDLPLVTESERQQMLVEWNDTATDYPADVLLHELFEAQVTRTPDAVAVAFEGQRLSYRELDANANQLAHHLQKRGVGPETLVPICVERSLEMVVGLLGILKAGGGYVPIDPDLPVQRIGYILEEVQPPSVLTQHRFCAKLPFDRVRTICLDTDWPAIAQEPTARPSNSTIPSNIAYVIYTSGSTGRPKGVMVPHVGICHHMFWIRRVYPLADTDVVLQNTNYSFDASLWELFAPLLAGATLVVPQPGVAVGSPDIASMILAHRVSTLQVVPSQLRLLLEEPAYWRCAPPLKHVFCAGEVLARDLCDAFYARLPQARLHNMYGPTETIIESTAWDVPPDGRPHVIPIGRPIDNTRAYIVNPQMQLSPVGVPGELLIGGIQLARGYLNHAELTAEKFVPDPFLAEPGARVYKTGDLARYLHDGNIEWLGRIDDQVKVRGLRIELGEIEVVLAEHPAVRGVVVLAREDTPGDKRLVAYIVAETPPADLTEQLLMRLDAALPAYMIPAHIVILDSLPLTSNGKVDRKQLPAPEITARRDAAYAAPRTPVEEILAGIWSEVLGLQRVGVHNNFLGAGGHSLSAMRVVSRVRQAFGVELTLREFFSTPTIAGLANLIEVLLAGPRSALMATKPEAAFDTEPAEASFPQQRLWFLDQVEPGGAAYIIADAFEIRGELDASLLERALGVLVSRHDSLRTVFVDVEGRLFQVVTERALWTLPVVDLSLEVDGRQRLAQLLRVESSRGFALAKGPLFRARLYRIVADTYVLLLTMHHIIADGWSLAIVMRELVELYARLARGESATLPALPVQYSDFARWQRNWLKGEALEVLLAHWRARLAGAPHVLELPTDRARPSVESHRGAIYSYTLPVGLAEGLRELGQREGATLFMTLLTGFSLLLSRYSGQQDFLVGTAVANRNHTEIENVVGLFINTLVLRANLSGDVSARELLARMRGVCLDAFAHRDLPFDRLVEDMRPQRDLSRNPLFQVMFVLQIGPWRPPELPGFTLEPVDVDRGAAQVDLRLDMHETAAGFQGIFEYATDLFDETTIARMATHLRALLEAMVSSPDRRVTELPLLSDAERHQLQVEWNATAAAFPERALMHELFEAQAQRTPERTALKSGAESRSYAQLDARANRLAQMLRARGVGRGQRVGLCVERGAQMLSAVLGILKVGAAYVPLDPAFPQERLRFMAQDAQLTLLVSTSVLAKPFGLPRERHLLLDADAGSIESAPAARLPLDASSAQPEDAAYVIYTSGATGTPKGVVVPHRAVVNFLTSMAREPGLGAEDVLVAVTTLSFDIAVLELQLPLTLGATVVIASREEAIDGQALKGLLEQHRASVMQATPVTWRLLIEAGWKAPQDFKALVGGEALPRDLAEQLIACGVELWNMYGPTETTVWSTCARITDTSNGIPIGKPIANTTAYVLDAYRNLCPIGVPGELCIGGAGVTLGYWRRPELSAERFIPDPYSATPGARLYRTGDRARWRAEGTLEHLGRIDDQVKVRGFRVELGEIETILAEHPAVRQAAVHLWTLKADDVRIVACCVPAKAGALAPVSLRKHLRARLPEYMIPQYFLPVEAIALLPNGKVDRRRLPTPLATESAIGQHEAPADAVEATIAEIWTQLVQPARPIGRNDRFFEMGGHSLLALRALRQMEQQLGVKLDFQVFFQESLAEIATRCRSERIAEGGLERGAARPVALQADA